MSEQNALLELLEALAAVTDAPEGASRDDLYSRMYVAHLAARDVAKVYHDGGDIDPHLDGNLRYLHRRLDEWNAVAAAGATR